GLFVPAGTPEAVGAKLRDAAKAAGNDATFQGALAKVETPLQYLDQPQVPAFWGKDAQKLAEGGNRVGEEEGTRGDVPTSDSHPLSPRPDSPARRSPRPTRSSPLSSTVSSSGRSTSIPNSPPSSASTATGTG